MGWDQPVGWGLATAASVALAIWGHAPSRRIVHIVFKPLATFLIIGAVFAVPTRLGTAAYGGIFVALLLSAAGDIFLMWPDRLFVAGLAAFLLAHVAYCAVFTLGVAWSAWQLFFLLPPLGATALIVHGLWSHLGRLRPAVLLYVAALTAMGWRVLARYDAAHVTLSSWVWASVGVGLFVVADSLLARQHFLGKEVPYGVRLGPYFAAQWCLVSATWV